MNQQEQKYPEGHFSSLWVGIGVAIGSGLGVAFAVAIGNMAFMGMGIPIGVAIGVAIGQAQEAKYKAEGTIRPLTESETKKQKMVKWALFGILLAGFLVFLGVFALL